MLGVINRLVQAASVLAVVWVFWQATQDRLTPGRTLAGMGVVLLSVATQYLVIKQEPRDPSSDSKRRAPGRLP